MEVASKATEIPPISIVAPERSEPSAEIWTISPAVNYKSSGTKILVV